jgi:hypothetical protein
MVADPHHLYEDPDAASHFNADPDPTIHFKADPDPVAECTDPDWGDSQLRHRDVVPACCQATWADGPVRQPYAGVDFIPQSRIYEFGYCSSSK